MFVRCLTKASFDGTYSLLVLHFVSDAHRAVREMRRVLRPGARAQQPQFGPGAACAELAIVLGCSP